VWLQATPGRGHQDPSSVVPRGTPSAPPPSSMHAVSPSFNHGDDEDQGVLSRSGTPYILPFLRAFSVWRQTLVPPSVPQ
jgi:hypothetical protein